MPTRAELREGHEDDYREWARLYGVDVYTMCPLPRTVKRQASISWSSETVRELTLLYEWIADRTSRVLGHPKKTYSLSRRFYNVVNMFPCNWEPVAIGMVMYFVRVERIPGINNPEIVADMLGEAGY